jgi:hypothetical protein
MGCLANAEGDEHGRQDEWTGEEHCRPHPLGVRAREEAMERTRREGDERQVM